jgi:hypothetical protein
MNRDLNTEEKLIVSQEERTKIKQSLLRELIEKVDIIKYTIDIINKQGLMSLYSGIESSVIGSILQNGIYFFASKLWRYFLDYFDVKLHPVLQSMLINFIAAICTAVAINPIWVLNARMANKKKNVSIILIIWREKLEILK